MALVHCNFQFARSFVGESSCVPVVSAVHIHNRMHQLQLSTITDLANLSELAKLSFHNMRDLKSARTQLLEDRVRVVLCRRKPHLAHILGTVAA